MLVRLFRRQCTAKSEGIGPHPAVDRSSLPRLQVHAQTIGLQPQSPLEGREGVGLPSPHRPHEGGVDELTRQFALVHEASHFLDEFGFLWPARLETGVELVFERDHLGTADRLLSEGARARQSGQRD